MPSVFMRGISTLENKYYYLAHKEFLLPWLQYSIEQLEDGIKPSLDQDTVRFIKFACQELKLEYPVFFMAMDLMEKYSDHLKKEKIENKDSITSIMCNILLANKLAGQRADLSIQLIVCFLKKLEYMNYSDTIIQNNEIEIMKMFNYKFILHSTLDEMQMLISFCIEPVILIDFFQNQCKDLLSVFYFYATKIVKILDTYYETDGSVKNKNNHLKRLYKNKFYIPAGIILCAVKGYKGSEVLNYHKIKNIIHYCIIISQKDLDILELTLCYLFDKLMARK